MADDHLTFQSFLTALKAELEFKGKYEDVIKNFHSEKPVSEMFKYFWSLEEAHSNLGFSLVPSFKSEEKADSLRAEGNKFYQNNILDKALDFYNFSIMVAPHPDIKCSEFENNNVSKSDNNNNQKSKSLALGFANRSAVLFELDQFEKCIGDIDLALKYGYPQDQQSKLAERKSKCLISLNKQKDAQSLLESTITTLADVNLDKKKKEATRSRLSKLLQECQQGTTKKPQKSESSAKSFEHIFSFQNRVAPQLSKENPNMPGASNKVQMKYTKEKGRFLVTDRTVMPGELLLVEKSYASCPYVKPEVLSTHCCNCLVRCNNPLPCPNCAMAVFCSDKCRTTGWKGFHCIECPSLSTLAVLNLGQNFCTLLYRMIAQTPYAHLRDLLNNCEKENNQVNSEMKGFNNKGIFDTSEFASVFSLVGNIEHRSPDDLLKRASLAYVLLQLLIQSKSYFLDPSGESFSPDDKEILLLGSLLMSLVMKMPCNSMVISEFNVNIANKRECNNEDIGAGMFPLSCLMNHSCNPSASHHSYGTYKATYASKYLPEGSEITISYGYHYANDEMTVRKSQLKSAYFFDCQCEACKDEWPMLSNLSLKPSLKNSNSMKQSEMKKLWMQFQMAKENFVKSYENIAEGQVGKSEIKSCSDLVVFLDKNVTVPCRMYYETQEALKHCLERGTPCTFVSK
ncbi:unnamed protein product [Meganyctiphanes norvegica]|uniref:Protein-lysine N-methyltransferase SMYD4 n=1 Tax=Meganyctiphanes norvegica TaxID=48144 RepID=A0AAV2S6F9_MEGNR